MCIYRVPHKWFWFNKVNALLHVYQNFILAGARVKFLLAILSKLFCSNMTSIRRKCNFLFFDQSKKLDSHFHQTGTIQNRQWSIVKYYDIPLKCIKEVWRTGDVYFIIIFFFGEYLTFLNFETMIQYSTCILEINKYCIHYSSIHYSLFYFHNNII